MSIVQTLYYTFITRRTVQRLQKSPLARTAPPPILLFPAGFWLLPQLDVFMCLEHLDGPKEGSPIYI